MSLQPHASGIAQDPPRPTGPSGRGVRAGFRFVLLLMLVLVPAAPSGAQEIRPVNRVALVIGNGHYETLGVLPNPPRDAAAVRTRERLARADLARRSQDYELAVEALESILEDAGRRDQALEDYYFYLDKKHEQIKGQVEADNQRLQQEIDEFMKQKQELMERNRTSLAEAGRIRDEFRKLKQAEEKRLYDIVTPFVSPGENPVELT